MEENPSNVARRYITLFFMHYFFSPLLPCSSPLYSSSTLIISHYLIKQLNLFTVLANMRDDKAKFTYAINNGLQIYAAKAYESKYPSFSSHSVPSRFMALHLFSLLLYYHHSDINYAECKANVHAYDVRSAFSMAADKGYNKVRIHTSYYKHARHKHTSSLTYDHLRKTTF